MNNPFKSKRVPFYRRRYLINPRVQLEIVAYFLVFFAVSWAIFYFWLDQVMNTLDQEVMRLNPGCSQVVQTFQDIRLRTFNRFFYIFAPVSIVLTILGGILVSHRVVGPIYRIKAILLQLLEGKEPNPVACRKSDFLQDIFPILRQVLKKKSNERDGMTLLELIVVCALVGILTTIAGASYQKLRMRARQAEAKLVLSTIFTAEKAFFIENQSYTMCLKQIGVYPSTGMRYYAVGYVYDEGMLGGSTASRCGLEGNRPCILYSFAGAGQQCNPGPGRQLVTGDSPDVSDVAYASNVEEAPVAPPPGGITTAHSFVSNSRFTASAAGMISPDSGQVDIWTINQDKTLYQLQSGI